MTPDKTTSVPDQHACQPERRQAARIAQCWRPVLRLVVRPSFVAREVAVRDISVRGLGLMCAEPLPIGASIALLWEYGLPPVWRTVQARVTRLSPRRKGGWIVGCAFNEALRSGEIEAFLLRVHESAEYTFNQ